MSRRGARHDRHRGGSGATAMVIIDMLNPYEHPEADRLAERVEKAQPALAAMRERAELVEPVLPREGHSFVIKARHSAFYDAVAAIYDHLAEAALEMMERNLSAELCPASECSLG